MPSEHTQKRDLSDDGDWKRALPKHNVKLNLKGTGHYVYRVGNELVE